MTDASSLDVPASALRATCDPASLPFETTETVTRVSGTVGQDRALEALDFGLRVGTQGFNLYVSGVPGSGRSTTVLTAMRELGQSEPPADDWCYVHNFDDSYRPRALRLPSGAGPGLAADVDGVLDRCRTEIPRAFDSETYQQRRQQIALALDRRREEMYGGLEREANEHGLTVRFGPAGILVLPLVNGQPLNPEEFQNLPEPERQRIREQGEAFQQHLHMVEALKGVREVEQEAAEQFQALDKESIQFAVGHLLEGLRARYQAMPQVVAYLSVVQEQIAAHADLFRPQAQAQPGEPPGPGRPPPLALPEDPFARFRVNVVVTSDPGDGAPVVFEHNPTYYNLMGRVDYRPAFGTMSTDFRLIKGGAVHRANGGYLLLQAKDLLSNPMAWEALKRALDTRQAAIENLGDNYSAVPTLTMRPEPIPLDIKVVLVGAPLLQNMLFQVDEDFRKLFKVRADFDVEMDRTDTNIGIYAGFIRARVDEDNLLHFDRSGVARIVEHGSRLLEHQEKLSTRFIDIADIVSEASYWAGKAGARYVSGDHVQQAIAYKEGRSALWRDKAQRIIREGVIDIATEGRVVGQVNGLSVLQAADLIFAVPSRITARVSPGSRGVVNVEREIEMSGKIHSKGVMMLAGYLAGRYAREAPLSLAASLAFEQLYNEVDGDSASSAELYCLLSALADTPLSQGLAVTGSVNQQGEVQAVGGVQYKIEGFFDVCHARGLTGSEGVLVPRTNLRHLMLREDVVEAVGAGRFHVYAIGTIDEGIELLTGIPAGAAGPDGAYPSGSINARVQECLHTYAHLMRAFTPDRGA